MKKTNVVELDGREYVILERAEYERLTGLARVGAMPPLPEADENGNFPAVEYARASIARSIIRERTEAGLTQRELARLAGVRVETLCRIETGKHTASVATVTKLDRALKHASSGRNGRAAAHRPTRRRGGSTRSSSG